MVREKVRSTILNNGLIEKGERIVVGLSGGPDSVCLFHVLYQLREELDIRLHGVHINHGLRPGAADEDQRYAESLCAEYQVPCDSFSFDVNRIARDEGISSEDAGRQVRYRSFFEVASRIAAETGCPVKIAVAQNMNDQAETLLMRIIRGTGIDGLAGIEYLRREKGNVIIRPLLDVTREEIEEYCRENGLNPRIDKTNLEPIYTRNKIRLELLPYLRKNFNPNIDAALSRLSRIAKEDKDYFGQRAEEIIAKYAAFSGGRADIKDGNRGDRGVRVSVPAEILREAPPALRHRIVVRLLESIGLSKDITASHLEQADRLLKEGRTSASTDFTAGYAMKISYDAAEFYKKEELRSLNFEYEINVEGITEIPELNAGIGVKILRRQDWLNGKENNGNNGDVSGNSKGQKNGNGPWRLSFDKIEASGRRPVLRTRRQGDYIVPLGMKGRKKLQDFFVDEKYVREERDRIPLLCLGPEVIWVAGGRISENYKVD
ncbi:MAG TPA: tRNA lysidine(34) synthetase TilS, partial [Bacillota bacterium]|nr:tRNA lysidine(34) synthetase TilS [Bacillota bacterium]